MEKKKKRKKKRHGRRRSTPLQSLLQGLFLGFCICLLAFSIWKLATIFIGYSSGDKEYKDLQQYVLSEPETPDQASSSSDNTSDDTSEEAPEAASSKEERIDFASLKKINEEAVGWIEIPGTEISYPVVHTTDNVYYLTHTFRRQENKSGAIFVEASNAGDFSDLHTIVYGHNMKNGTMFADLNKYKDKEFYESHKEVQFDTLTEEGTYKVVYAFVTEVNKKDSFKYYEKINWNSKDEFNEYVSNLEQRKLYDTGEKIKKKDKLLTLSTCEKASDNSRMVVVCKKKQNQ